MKRFVVTIGYSEYALDIGDACALLAIAQRAVRVESQGYRQPLRTVPGSEPFANALRMADVVEDPPAEPDDGSAANEEVVF